MQNASTSENDSFVTWDIFLGGETVLVGGQRVLAFIAEETSTALPMVTIGDVLSAPNFYHPKAQDA
jgi:hypothetical protein